MRSWVQRGTPTARVIALGSDAPPCVHVIQPLKHVNSGIKLYKEVNCINDGIRGVPDITQLIDELIREAEREAGQDGGKEAAGCLELRKAFSRRSPRLGSLALRNPTAVSATRMVRSRVHATYTTNTYTNILEIYSSVVMDSLPTAIYTRLVLNNIYKSYLN